MKIIYLRRLEEFSISHANARKSLTTWKNVVLKANWQNRRELLKDFSRAKMIKNNRARFEIVHNIYRLVAHIDYEGNYVEIRFIGTHSDYDRIDASII